MRYGPEENEVAHANVSQLQRHPHVVTVCYGGTSNRYAYAQDFLVFAEHQDKAVELLKLDIEATIKAIPSRASKLKRFLGGYFKAREVNAGVYPVSYFDDYRSIISTSRDEESQAEIESRKADVAE